MSRLHDWKYPTLPTNICRQWVKAFNTFTYWTMCFLFRSAHSIMKVWCIERQSFIVIFCKFLIQMVTLMNKQWFGKDITSLESQKTCEASPWKASQPFSQFVLDFIVCAIIYQTQYLGPINIAYFHICLSSSRYCSSKTTTNFFKVL